MGDRVLGDLGDDGLSGPQDLFDAGLLASLHIVGVELQVSPVEHGVLGCADINERRLHAGQNILNLGQVHVSVNLTAVVGRPGQVVLDERPALEYRQLGRAVGDADTHQVAADRPTPAFTSASAPEGGLVQLDRAVVVDGPHRPRLVSTLATTLAATAPPASAAAASTLPTTAFAVTSTSAGTGL